MRWEEELAGAIRMLPLFFSWLDCVDQEFGQAGRIRWDKISSNGSKDLDHYLC